MTLTNTLTMLGLVALPLAATRFDPSQAQPSAAPAAAAADSAAALVPKLGDKDYQARKAAYRALERMGAKARVELEKALESDDPEVRWSASLLLDRLDENEADGALGRLRARTDDELDEIAPPDPQPRTPRMPRSIRTPEDAPEDIIQQMRDAMRHLRFDDDAFGRDGFDLAPGSSFSRVVENDGQRESVTVRVDANGHVTAEQEKGGEKLTFEADSIEALKQAHPELLNGFGGGFGGGSNVRIAPFGRDLPKAHPNEIQPRAPKASKGNARRHALVKPADPAPAPTPDQRPRLGVQVAPVSADVARWLELEPGLGLEVVKVVPGSAAAKLGIQARDIITEVNGREIRAAEDVADALGDQDAAAAEVLRRGAEQKLDRAR